MPKPLDIAIRKAGTQAKLARLLGVEPQVISHWQRRGVSVRRCQDIARIAGTSLYRVRPEIFPKGT